MKQQNEGIFSDKKRSGRPKVTSSGEDRLMHKVVSHSSMSSSKTIEARLKDPGTEVSIKTI